MKDQVQLLDPDRLLRNSEWLSRLARGLVPLDEADDLAQETLVVGLTSRAPHRSTRAWLAGIARNLAKRKYRRGATRRARELERPEPGASRPADELLLRAEMQRGVIDAVTELDEPYRTTILLRYFEGLSIEELSRRTGVPSSTERTRLKRALERLRARLDAEYGARDRWSAMVVALAVSSSEGAGLATGAGSAANVIAEVASMGTKAKAVVGIAAATGVALLGIQVLSDSSSEAARSSGLDLGEARPASRELEQVVPDVVDAPTASARAQVEGELSARDLLVFGALRTNDGVGIDAARVKFVDNDAETVTASIGADGTYSVFGITPGEWSVRVTGDGLVPLRREVRFSGRSEAERVDLVVERAARLRVRLEDSEGSLLEWYEGLVAVATLGTPPALLPGIGGRDASEFGAGRFHADSALAADDTEVPPGVSGLLDLHDRLPLHVSVVLHNVVLETRLVRSAEEDAVFVLDREKAIEGQLASATLRVVDETGSPLAGNVDLSHSQRHGGGNPTDEDGRVHFEGVLPGVMELGFRFFDHEFLRKRVRIRPGVENDLGTVQLASSRTIRGRVVDPDGFGVAVTLSAVAIGQVVLPHDGASRRALQSSTDGTFEINRVGRGPIRLLARSKAGTVASMRVDADSPEAQEIVFVLPPSGRVLFDPGALANSHAQLTLADGNGVPFWSYPIRFDHVFERKLAHGDYQVWLGEDERVDRVLPFTVGADVVRIDLEEWVVR